jgi:preprotein translocase subunit SecE
MYALAPKGVLNKAKNMANPLQFLREARSELGKVVWPSRRDLLRITMAVVILSLVVAVFLGLIDYGLNYSIEYFINKQ